MRALAMQAVDFGSPELAEAAAIFLDKHYGLRAGEMAEARAVVGPIDWSSEQQPGHGILRWDNHDWDMWDFRDKLALDEDTLARLRGKPEQEPAEVELRECAILNVAAEVLYSETGTVPDAEQVQLLALKMRGDMLAKALAADEALGEVPPMMTQAEADVRVFFFATTCSSATMTKTTACVQPFPLKSWRTRPWRPCVSTSMATPPLRWSLAGTTQGTPKEQSGCLSTGATCGYWSLLMQIGFNAWL